MKKVILASGSPRRKILLEQAGIPFEMIKSDLKEVIDAEISPYDLVKSISSRKALRVSEMITDEAIIIGADTVVAIHGKVLGKPKCKEEAVDMLKSLQGKKHSVYTGVTIINKHAEGLELKYIIDNTNVYMRKLTQDEILDYVQTGEPDDKAGAYAIQGKGAVLIERIEGNYDTVVGLPLVKVYLALREWGLRVEDMWGK